MSMKRSQKRGTQPKHTCPGMGEGCTLNEHHRGDCVPQRAIRPAYAGMERGDGPKERLTPEERRAYGLEDMG